MMIILGIEEKGLLLYWTLKIKASFIFIKEEIQLWGMIFYRRRQKNEL
jgi:hypothetical protein